MQNFSFMSCYSYINSPIDVVQVLPQDEDILLLLVAVGGVEGTDGEVEERLVVVRGRHVPGVLVEGDLALVEYAVQVHPRPDANGEERTS